MSLMKTETPTTEIETVNPNPTAEVSTEPTAETGTETEEPTATVAAEPERQYTCREEGCGLTGPVGAFKAPDTKNIIATIRAATGQKTGRVTITTAQMAAYATCEACARRISAERGVGYWPLQWGLNRVVAAKPTKPEEQAPVPVIDNDPEAAVMVACFLCEKQVARADEVIIGWWGAKILANVILGRNGGLATNHETNLMLMNTGIGEGAQKCPAVCKDCAVLARPKLIAAATELTFVKLMDDEERGKQFGYQLKPMPLMVAIRKAREYEAKGAAMAAEEEATRAKEEADREAKATRDATLTAKLEAFLGSAVSKKPHNGGNPGKGGKHNNGRNGGRGERGGGNRGRWGNSDD